MFDTNALFTFAMFLNVALFFLLLYFLIQTNAKDTLLQETDQKKGDLSESKEKSTKILSQAIKNANKMLVDSELRGLKLFSESKLDANKFSEKYERKISDLENYFKNEFERRLTETETTYKDFLKSLSSSLETHASQNEKILEDKTLDMIKHTDDLITTQVTQIESDVKARLDKELETVREEIKAYKENRLHIIDENIVEILEKTLSVTLGKKLSLTDQSDLIYKALEEAKKEHALE